MRPLLVLAAAGALLGCGDPASPTLAASIELSPEALAIGPTQSATLVAVVRGADGQLLTDRQVAWTSDDAAVATVTAGQVLAVSYGEATITASVDGKSAEAAITVTATLPAHLVGWWRMQSFDGKTVPATYWSEDDAPIDTLGNVADVVIRLDSARMEMRADGTYPYRQYCFSELHDGVLQFRYCWGDFGRFTLPQPGALSLVSEYIQNLTASGSVTVGGDLALLEPLVTQEPPRATVWRRPN